MSQEPQYLVRLFDARQRSSTAGKTVWLKHPMDERSFARMRERAWRFPSAGQAQLAVERLPALYHATVETVRP